jgi:hypothetical protein
MQDPAKGLRRNHALRSSLNSPLRPGRGALGSGQRVKRARVLLRRRRAGCPGCYLAVTAPGHFYVLEGPYAPNPSMFVSLCLCLYNLIVEPPSDRRYQVWRT